MHRDLLPLSASVSNMHTIAIAVRQTSLALRHCSFHSHFHFILFVYSSLFTHLCMSKWLEWECKSKTEAERGKGCWNSRSRKGNETDELQIKELIHSRWEAAKEVNAFNYALNCMYKCLDGKYELSIQVCWFVQWRSSLDTPMSFRFMHCSPTCGDQIWLKLCTHIGIHKTRVSVCKVSAESDHRKWANYAWTQNSWACPNFWPPLLFFFFNFRKFKLF